MRMLKAQRFDAGSLCAQIIKHVEVKDEKAKRKSMFSNWSSVVCINLEAFGMCDALLAAGSGLPHAFEACFARKASNAFSKRRCDLHLVAWDFGEIGTMRIDGLAVELGKRAAPMKQASLPTVQQVIAQGYLELQVLAHKSARSCVLKKTFLPLVAPIFSISSVDWFRTCLQAREALGLTTQGRLDKPFLCRLNVAGEATAQELT
eukprot:s575_g16.t1